MAGVSSTGPCRYILTNIEMLGNVSDLQASPLITNLQHHSTTNKFRSSLFRRNQIFLATVFAGAFAFEM